MGLGILIVLASLKTKWLPEVKPNAHTRSSRHYANEIAQECRDERTFVNRKVEPQATPHTPLA